MAPWAAIPAPLLVKEGVKILTPPSIQATLSRLTIAYRVHTGTSLGSVSRKFLRRHRWLDGGKGKRRDAGAVKVATPPKRRGGSDLSAQSVMLTAWMMCMSGKPMSAVGVGSVMLHEAELMKLGCVSADGVEPM